MNIQQFTDLADSIISEEIPAELLAGLNLGISIIPDVQEQEDHYIMGEYICDDMGNRVLLYYGSFAELLQDESKKKWIDELKETLLHELQHHVEALAGEEDLARAEEEEDW